MGTGLRFEQDRQSDDGICAVGRWDLVKIWAGKWEWDPPFGTLYKTNDKQVDLNTNNLVRRKCCLKVLYITCLLLTEIRLY